MAIALPPLSHSSPTLRGCSNLVLTHFSARYQDNPQRSPSIDDVRAEALAHYSGQLILARDLQRYHLDREGRLQPIASL